MPDTVITVSRRMALGGATTAVAAVAAGCQWGPPSAVDAPAEKRDADAASVASLTAAMTTQARLVADVAVRHVGLATALAPLTALHEAHLDVLSESRPTGAAATVPTASDAALSAVRRGELALQRSLTAAARSAASGPLARTLASMAAGVAMHLSALPTAKGGAS